MREYFPSINEKSIRWKSLCDNKNELSHNEDQLLEWSSNSSS